MSQTLCILGRQSTLSLAELEALCGADNLHPIGQVAALIDTDPATIDFSRLGGTVKFCKLLAKLTSPKWTEVEAYLSQAIPPHLSATPPGKLQFGLSVYGFDVTPTQINATGLRLKKVIRSHGKSVRVVANTVPALTSAQVLHNKLTHPGSWELVIVRDGNQTFLAQNIAEQDIEAYSRRDQQRPKRDSRVGMLPPKLAQIIVNLSGARPHDTLWDPFCGTGVLLQEALLMSMEVCGSDLDSRMIDYSQTNLRWLQEKIPDICGKDMRGSFALKTADARTVQFTPTFGKALSVIASETYLGHPFHSAPKEELLQKTMQEVDTLHLKFLQNLCRQTKPGFQLCLAVPAWHIHGKVHHLRVLDSLPKLGYTRQSFVHATDRELIYHRPQQIVGRELVVLVRK